MVGTEVVWSCSLRQSFRYYPVADRVTSIFLDGDGKTEEQILAQLPYQAARAGHEQGSPEAVAPDRRRFRDPRSVYEQIGLLKTTDESLISLSPLGRALSDWRACLNEANLEVLASHVATGLAACQLRNPTRLGSKYDASMQVFPMAFIWGAMLQCENRITSDELNCEVFRLRNADELSAAVTRIQAHRADPDHNPLQAETVTGSAKNDRVIPWMAMASCGWLLIMDKRETGADYYEIRPSCVRILTSAVMALGPHRDFATVGDYLQHLHESAKLQHRPTK